MLGGTDGVGSGCDGKEPDHTLQPADAGPPEPGPAPAEPTPRVAPKPRKPRAPGAHCGGKSRWSDMDTKAIVRHLVSAPITPPLLIRCRVAAPL